MKNRYFAAAKAVAMTSPGVGKRKSYRLGAILVQKGQIISAGVNSYKTHPKLNGLFSTQNNMQFLDVVWIVAKD